MKISIYTVVAFADMNKAVTHAIILLVACLFVAITITLGVTLAKTKKQKEKEQEMLEITKRQNEELERTKAELQKAVQEAQSASRAKSAFLFNMSHDIRTPMNAVIGFTTLLGKSMDDKEKRDDYLHKLRASGELLLSILNNILEMARIEKGILQIEEQAWSTEQMNDTLYSIFHQLMSVKGIHFTRNVNVEHKYVYCDPAKLQEIYINILSNAYKYTPPGGRVEMNLEELPCEKEGYALYRTTIYDTGIGMAPEFVEKMFDEFTRERNSEGNRIEGTGLGMAIVKRLVTLMNGTVEVDSQKGIGTTFTLTLPHRIATREDIVDHSKVEIDYELFLGKRILLAEDNDLNAEIAIELLGDAGFWIDRVKDGQSCVDVLAEAEEDYYDLILMDVQMPRLNGYDATKKIREFDDEKKSRIPIIAMTANAFDEDKRNALAAGMNAHLGKPIVTRDLMNILKWILSAKEKETELYDETER